MKKSHYLSIALVVTVALAGVWLLSARQPGREAPVASSGQDAPRDPRRGQAKAIRRTLPEIPPSMHLDGRPAEITAKITIRPDGTVSDVSMLKSDIPDANALVINACREWLFEPAGIEQETIFHMRFPPRDDSGAD